MNTAPLLHCPDLVDLRFVSWLELALVGVSPHQQDLESDVVVRLMDLQGSQAWWGITLHDRWLRGSNGAVTIFDSLPAADHFLRLLKVRRFNIGTHCAHGSLVYGQAQEVYTLGDHCNRCQCGDCGARRGQGFFHCPQLSQQRLASIDGVHVRQPTRHAFPVPVSPNEPASVAA